MSKPNRWRRALRRAGRVSVGAAAGALACVVVACGGVDGASIFAARVPLPQAMVATATLARSRDFMPGSGIRTGQHAPSPTTGIAQRLTIEELIERGNRKETLVKAIRHFNHFGRCRSRFANHRTSKTV